MAKNPTSIVLSEISRAQIYRIAEILELGERSQSEIIRQAVDFYYRHVQERLKNEFKH